jgi:hypothetical protein
MHSCRTFRLRGTPFTCFMLYWYKSTTTDAKGAARSPRAARGTPFTCFTGTKVQLLTQKALLDRRAPPLLRHACTFSAILIAKEFCDHYVFGHREEEVIEESLIQYFLVVYS